MDILTEGAKALGINLSPGQLAQFNMFAAAIRQGNQRANLTAITAPEEMASKHFLDSLTAAIPLLPELRAGQSRRLIDVGTGAGFPGIPLKIAFPALHLTLLEATGKKARFLEEVVGELELSDTLVVAHRAETAGRNPEHRDAYDWATGRALGPLAVVIELCAPFLEPGGLLVAQRRGNLEEAVSVAAPAFGALKMWARAPVPILLPALSDGRGLVVGEKYSATPDRYPRRSGMAKKSPLAPAGTEPRVKSG